MKIDITKKCACGLLWLATVLSPLSWAAVGGTLSAALLSSCSESEGQEDELANWKQRNELFFASLSDSLAAKPAEWLRFKNYSLDEGEEGLADDYVYVKVMAAGEGGDSPMFTDSVRVSYQGRLLPTTSYPDGYVFDGTVYGRYDDATNSTAKQLVSGMRDGYTTALLHMHRGDYWRVYIPAELGYGADGNGSTIPGYSVLVFDITLIDISAAGNPMPVWSARRSR